MSHILILNAHQSYPFSEGRLNSSLVGIADELFQSAGHSTRVVSMEEEWQVAEQIDHHLWADLIFLQSPVNWMGVPWKFKQYMDEVFTAGMSGQLCDGDGRHSAEPERQYGSGGKLAGRKYMLSLTLNAPESAFDDDSQLLFQGKSVDDLFLPMHMNFQFFGLQALPTFVCYDVMKNPQIDSDFARFRTHLQALLPA